jgi:hypothetical protein
MRAITAPSMTGASPRRTVSTSGSSGILPVGVPIGAHFAFCATDWRCGPAVRAVLDEPRPPMEKGAAATILEQPQKVLRFENAAKQDPRADS